MRMEMSAWNWNHDEVLSNFAFKFNLRRYNLVQHRVEDRGRRRDGSAHSDLEPCIPASGAGADQLGGVARVETLVETRVPDSSACN
jgi:hypothetical protein